MTVRFFRSLGPYLIFALIYLSLRLFWLDGDCGVPAIWEYGHHFTDEGFYLLGGKEMYLHGHFADPLTSSISTYSFCPLTHWIGWLSCLCFGLSEWKHRIFFLAIYFGGWTSIFFAASHLVSRRFACCVVTVVSSLPMVLDMERAASNDCLLASLVAISFALVYSSSLLSRKNESAPHKGLLLSVGGIVFFALAGLIKPSIWLLLPFLLAAVSLTQPIVQKRIVWKSLLIISSAIALIFLLKHLSSLTLISDWEHLDSENGMPKLFNDLSMFDVPARLRSLSTFPRGKVGHVLAVLAPLLTALPLAAATLKLLRREVDGKFVLYLAIPFYTLALATMDYYFSHYWLPVIMLLPVFFAALCQDFTYGDKCDCGFYFRAFPWCRFISLLIVLGVISFVLTLLTRETYIKYACDSVLPVEANTWCYAWPFMLVASVAMVYFIGFNGRAFMMLPAAFFCISTAVATSLTRGWMYQSVSSIVILDLMAVFPMLAIFSFRQSLPFPRDQFGTVVACFFTLTMAIVAPWRDATIELLDPASHCQKEVAEDIVQTVEPNAVIFGLAADQILLGHPIRTASQVSRANLFNTMETIHSAIPEAPVYILFNDESDLQGASRTDYLSRRLEFVKAYQLPSCDAGAYESRQSALFRIKFDSCVNPTKYE